jgi:hypothetical protein
VLISLLSFRDAPKGAGPESIITAGGYGFRARRFAAPRNDDGWFPIRMSESQEGKRPHSRGAFRVRVLQRAASSARRGRREHRVFQPHPWSRVQQRKHTSSSPQVQPLHRRSLRDGVNAYLRALPGVRDLIVTVACDTSRRLSASPGAPGPHDFAVRNSRARRTRSCIHRIPRPTLVTIAKRPS